MPPTPASDADVYQACLAGDPDAFAALVERYTPLVCAVCYAALGDRAAAEDLAQDTFLVAWRSLPTLRDPAKIGGWLSGIARNLSRNARRLARWNEVPIADVEAASREAAMSPLDLALARESEQVVRDMLRELPVAYREALILFYWEGRSGKQVADRLGLTEAAVLQRLSRGRSYLKHEVGRVEAALDHQRPAAAVVVAIIAALASATTARAAAGGGGATAAARTSTAARTGRRSAPQAGWLAALVVATIGVVVVARGADEVRDTTAAARAVEQLPALAELRPREIEAREPAAADAAPEPPGRFRVDGVVVDGDGAPVDGAVVAIGTEPPRQVATRPDGTFRFGGLVERVYEIEARADDRVSTRALWRPVAGADPLILGLGAGTALEVAVVDERTRAPIPAARVELSSIGVIAATTGASGTAALRGLAPGSYLVATSAPGYGRTWTSIDVAAQPGELERATVALPRGAAISGTVHRRGAPVGGVVVIAEALHGSMFATRLDIDEATTDREGRWQFAGLTAGSYRFVTRDRASSSESVHHDATAPIDGIAIELAETTTLAGRVVASSGQPASFAAVRVAVVPAADRMVAGGSAYERGVWQLELREVVCDAAGRFAMADLPARQLRVRAFAGGAVSAEEVVEAIDRARPRALTITLTQHAAIEGVVVSPSGAPIAGAQVEARPEVWQAGLLSGPIAAVADHQGRFTLPGLAAGAYVVRAARSAAGPRELASYRVVQVEPGPSIVRLIVDEPGAIAGSLRFEDGSIPDRFEVSLPWLDAAAFATPDGRFVLAGIAAGTHRLSINGPGFVGEERDGVVVAAGETTELGTIVVRRGRTIRGRVVSAGVGVAGATVIAGRGLRGDGSRLEWTQVLAAMGARRATTAIDGSFVITGIGSDELAVAAEHPAIGRAAVARIRAGEASVAPLELALARTGSLQGTVTRGMTGIESRVVAVPIDAIGAIEHEVVADPSGRFRFDALAAGSYQITAVLRGDRGGGTAVGRATIEPDRGAALELRIPIGTRVAVSLADDRPSRITRIVLLRGAHQPATPAELAALLHRLDREAVRSTFRVRIPGRVEQTEPPRFDDVEAGVYTACALAFGSATADERFACARVDVDGRPVQVALRIP